MKCIDLEMLQRYHDKELPYDNIKEVDEHLENCHECYGKLNKLIDDLALISKLHHVAFTSLASNSFIINCQRPGISREKIEGQYYLVDLYIF